MIVFIREERGSKRGARRVLSLYEYLNQVVESPLCYQNRLVKVDLDIHGRYHSDALTELIKGLVCGFCHVLNSTLGPNEEMFRTSF